MSNRLAIDVRSPDDSPWNQVELRFVIDGRDVISEVFDVGPGEDPDRLLGPDSPLLAEDEPSKVRLAEATCTWGCCGAIDVRIRRANGQVIWDEWSDPGVANVPLEAFRFEADQYEAELDRAHHSRGWEWPARAVARLLQTSLRADCAVMDRWNSSLDFVTSLPSSRDVVDVVFASPPRQAQSEYYERFGRPMDHAQFRLRTTLTDEPATLQAQRILAALRSEDPRENAEICGGSGRRT